MMRILTGLLLAAVLSCSRLSEQDIRQIRRAQADSLLNKTESWDFSLSLSELGHRAFKLKAAYGYTLDTDSGNVTYASGPVFIQVFDSTGYGVVQTVRCASLVYIARQAHIRLSGRVFIETSDGRRLNAEELFWLQEEKQLITPGFVTIVTPDDSLSGFGLRAKDDLSEYRIREVSGEVTVERDKTGNE